MLVGRGEVTGGVNRRNAVSCLAKVQQSKTCTNIEYKRPTASMRRTQKTAKWQSLSFYTLEESYQMYAMLKFSWMLPWRRPWHRPKTTVAYTRCGLSPANAEFKHRHWPRSTWKSSLSGKSESTPEAQQGNMERKKTHDVFLCQFLCHLRLCLIVKMCLLWFNSNYQHVYLHVQARTQGGGGGFTVANEPPRSFKFRFKINGMRAHCVRARFRDRSRSVFHRMRMRRSFNFQGSDRCRARKTK